MKNRFIMSRTGEMDAQGAVFESEREFQLKFFQEYVHNFGAALRPIDASSPESVRG